MNKEHKLPVSFLVFLLLIVTITAYIFLRSDHRVTLDDSKLTIPPVTHYAHFSIDDCNNIFEDLTNNQDTYSSIFDQEILGFLKKMHDQYGVVFSLYVFYDWDIEQPGFDLSMATGKFRDEFESHNEWLKFGFHASDPNFYMRNTPEEALFYYNLTIQELTRIVGECALDSFVRLDRYTASKDVVQALQLADYPLQGLLIADRADAETRASYGLSPTERKSCYTQDWYCDNLGMIYTPTDIRLEAIDSDETFYALMNKMHDQKVLIIFTHEFEITKDTVQRYCELSAQYIAEFNIKSDYPQNNIG